MTRPRLLASALAPLVALWLAVVAHAATPRTLVAKVNRVSDGDTVIATTSEGTTLRIRLLGIDAPEIPHGKNPGQPFGEDARDYLDHLIGGKTIRVDAYGPDRYKRILAVVGSDPVMSCCAGICLDVHPIEYIWIATLVGAQDPTRFQDRGTVQAHSPQAAGLQGLPSGPHHSFEQRWTG